MDGMRGAAEARMGHGAAIAGRMIRASTFYMPVVALRLVVVGARLRQVQGTKKRWIVLHPCRP